MKAKAAVKIPDHRELERLTAGGWVEYAKGTPEGWSGCARLNIYWIPTDPSLSSIRIEDTYIEILRSVKEQVTIPVAVKSILHEFCEHGPPARSGGRGWVDLCSTAFISRTLISNRWK